MYKGNSKINEQRNSRNKCVEETVKKTVEVNHKETVEETWTYFVYIAMIQRRYISELICRENSRIQ